MFVVSAPGKVILFGEHAVVHGVPAIAASVALHTYISVEESADPDVIELDFAEVKLKVSWKRQELPWKSVKHRDSHRALDPGVVSALDDLLAPLPGQFEHPAALAFAYLYLHICSPETPGFKLVSRSTLPVGAGLGSSASFSVCLASALLHLSGQIGVPEVRDEAALSLINDWAFLGESCIHGNPSGIDNVVATRGGAVLFKRRIGQTALVTPYEKFPPLSLVLTNTGVPRRTSELVAGVGALRDALPDVVGHIMDAIAAIVTKADNAIRNETNTEEITALIAELADVNHGLLVALGVSHPSLERVREVGQTLRLGSTKLTGAGGGGCAITIANSDTHSLIEDFREQLGHPFKVFETLLGGNGVGILPKIESLDLDSLKTPEDFQTLNARGWSHW